MRENTRRRTIHLALTCLLLGGVMTLLAAPGGQGGLDAGGNPVRSQRPEQVDASGRPVFDEAGTRRNYHRHETPAGPKAGATDAERRDGNAPRLKSTLEIEPEWHRVIYGVGIGATGLYAVDVTGDGALEVVAAAGPRAFGANDYWYVLREANGSYDHVWASNEYDQAITSLLAQDLDGDGDAEVLVATGGDVLFYDFDALGTPSLIRTVATAASSVLGLSLDDVDGDGGDEIVFCDSANLWIYDATTGAFEYQGAGFGGKDVAVGDVDADPGLEIVVGNDTSTGYVLDGATRAVEWTNASGFGTYVATGDLDGDGMEEIVAGYRWYDVNAYDADTQTLAWNVPLSYDLGALRLFDWEGDGALDVVLGEAQWGDILVHDGATGAFKDSVYNPDHGTTDVAFGDVDGDGQDEVLWGAGYSSSGADYLYVVDAATHVFEWQSTDITGPFYGLGFGDVDGDGATELFYTSLESESGYGDGLYFVHDGATKALEFQSGEPSASNFTEVYRIVAAQIDGDAPLELIVTTAAGYSGWLVAYDGSTHLQEWQVAIESGLSFRSLQVADVDSDGALEVVAGTGYEHSGATGRYVFVYDAATGALEWQSPHLGPGDCEFLRLAEVDGDAALEIVAGLGGEDLHVFDGQSHVKQLTSGDLDLTSMTTADRDGDGVEEILIGKSSGLVQVIDPATGAAVETVGSFGGAVHGLALAELTDDGVLDYVYAVDDEVRARDGLAGTVFWTSGVIGSDSGGMATPVGEIDSLVIGDLDDDGQKEVFVNLGLVGMRVYQATLNNVPTVAILAPADGSSIFDSLPVDFVGSASDPEEGDISASIAWSSDLDGALGGGASLQVTGLSLGTHTITAAVTDSGGLGDSESIALTIVPNTAPAVTITAPADGTVAPEGTSVAFAGSATDAEDGDLTAGLVWTSDRDGTIGAGAGFSRADLTAGTHTITASVTDAGNLTGVAAITLVVNAAPTVAITAPADGSVYTLGDLVSFAGSAADAEDGDLSGSISWSSDLDGALGSGATLATSALSAGAHTITASVTDSYGEPASAAISITVNVAPTVSITAPADGSSSTETDPVTFTGTASDPEDGDLTAALSWTSSLDGAIGSGGSFVVSSLSIGTHTITASVTDSHGAPGSAAITYTVYANVAPTVTVSAPANGSSSTETDPVTFTGTASDPEDGDLTASLSWTSSLDGAIGSGGSFTVSSLSIGTHTITASVTDSHGAPGSASIVFTVNPNTPPVVTILTPADGEDFTIGDTVTFTGSAFDAQDGDLSAALTWTSNRDGALGTGSLVATSTLSLGSHTITASVTDSHGATGLASITVLVRPLPVQVTFVSIAAEDGWIRESAGGSGVGGTFDVDSKNNSGLRLGDDNQDRQYKTIVSFDTSSIPDGAEIQVVTLQLVEGASSGTDPFTTHGACRIDVQSGGFNGSTALESADFEAPATAAQAGTLTAPLSGVSQGALDAAGRAALNALGTTQMRLSFDLATDGDRTADDYGFYASDNNTASNHPRLVVTYQEW